MLLHLLSAEYDLLTTVLVNVVSDVEGIPREISSALVLARLEPPGLAGRPVGGIGLLQGQIALHVGEEDLCDLRQESFLGFKVHGLLPDHHLRVLAQVNLLSFPLDKDAFEDRLSEELEDLA